MTISCFRVSPDPHVAGLAASPHSGTRQPTANYRVTPRRLPAAYIRKAVYLPVTSGASFTRQGLARKTSNSRARPETAL